MISLSVISIYLSVLHLSICSTVILRTQLNNKIFFLILKTFFKYLCFPSRELSHIPPLLLNFVHTAYFVMNNTLLSKINQGSPGGRRNERLAPSTLLGTWRNSSSPFYLHPEKFPIPTILSTWRNFLFLQF